MNILEELAEEPMGLLLVRLCERLDLPKTSLLSLLRALEDAHYVVNNNGVYQLGEAALRLSSLISVSFPFPHSVHNLLTKLMAECNETALLSSLAEDGLAAVYIDRVECQRPLRFSGFIGARRPLYCTATGKALLAFQDASFLRKYLRAVELNAFGAETITSKVQLEQELEKIRMEGVAAAINEHSEGIGAFASPVFDGVGGVVAAVSLAAPADRARQLQERYSQAVRSTAREMSLLLGWKPEEASGAE